MALARGIMTTPEVRTRSTRAQVLMRDVYRVGWAAGPYLLGSRLVRNGLGGAAVRLGRAYVTRNREQWRDNVTLATGRVPSDAEVDAAVRSWTRNFTESFVMPSWSPDRIVSTVTTDTEGERRLREAMATRGAVAALPHIGSWDHAGAWACATGMPVATVAEEFGDTEFAAFKRYREKLGMRIYSHRDPSALASLTRDVGEGYLACLVADRVFEGKGVPVVWRAGEVTRPTLAPVGPALLARRTGALLIGVSARYTRDGIHLAFSEPVRHRTGADGLRAMTQDLVDFYAAEVALTPTDWHVFVPFFADEVRP
ncbi:MAG TPA: phosphatidylinositol mannoside acyltransferase [Propionibacteriaceae bacterium]|nr:phosphatidylinositol mannoside acyltransferase [Propionibacteriaceae bacterium]